MILIVIQIRSKLRAIIDLWVLFDEIGWENL